ncbi:MAG: response regulator, partial [Bacteroidales bacterium]|nr:response regulator [Bacteroidales bacterium]
MSRKDDPKILIIEDDTDLVEAMKMMLRNRGYNIATAYDPKEGWKKLGSEKPDLIILDVMFGSSGEAKGFDFAQKIRYQKEFSSIPV